MASDHDNWKNGLTDMFGQVREDNTQSEKEEDPQPTLQELVGQLLDKSKLIENMPASSVYVGGTAIKFTWDDPECKALAADIEAITHLKVMSLSIGPEYGDDHVELGNGFDSAIFLYRNKVRTLIETDSGYIDEYDVSYTQIKEKK